MFAKKIAAMIVLLASIGFLAAYFMYPDLVIPFAKAYGGMQIGDSLTLGLPGLAWAVWQLKQREYKPGTDMKSCVLALDGLGRGSVEAPAKRFAARWVETQDVDFLLWQAEAVDGRVDLPSAHKELVEFVKEKVLGQYGHVYLAFGGTVETGMLVGDLLANLVDVSWLAFDKGEYEKSWTRSKKSFVQYELTRAEQPKMATDSSNYAKAPKAEAKTEAVATPVSPEASNAKGKKTAPKKGGQGGKKKAKRAARRKKRRAKRNKGMKA